MHDDDPQKVLKVEWRGDAWDRALAARSDIARWGDFGEDGRSVVLYRPDTLIVDQRSLRDRQIRRLLRRAKATEDLHDEQDRRDQEIAAKLSLSLLSIPDDDLDAVDLVRSLRRVEPRAASLHYVLVADPQRMGGTDPAIPDTRPGDIPGTNKASGKGTRIAVLDTGIDTRQTVFASSAEPSDSEVPDENTDEVLDFAAGHGTHVAGIISRHAPGAELIIERVLDSPEGVTSELAVARAILEHAGVDIINCSFGGFDLHDAAPLVLERAVARLPRETVVVAAAGNHGLERPHWPAALKGVIAVGAVGQEAGDGAWSRTDFSNYGGWVDCCAAGVDVHSSFLEFEETNPALQSPRKFEGGARWTGTSFATPFVSAAIAVLAADQGISASDAAHRLIHDPARQVIPGIGTLIA